MLALAKRCRLIHSRALYAFCFGVSLSGCNKIIQVDGHDVYEREIKDALAEVVEDASDDFDCLESKIQAKVVAVFESSPHYAQAIAALGCGKTATYTLNEWGNWTQQSGSFMDHNAP